MGRVSSRSYNATFMIHSLFSEPWTLLPQRIPTLLALSGPIMAWMGFVQLAAKVVREGNSQIYAQGETQKEIVDAKRTEQALHGCPFEIGPGAGRLSAWWIAS
jgi:hypothetical protein